MGTCCTDSLCSEGYHPFQTFQHVRNPTSKNRKQTDGPQVLNDVREWVQYSQVKCCNIGVDKPQPRGYTGPHILCAARGHLPQTEKSRFIIRKKTLKKNLQELVSYCSFKQNTITSIVSGNGKATFTPTKP